MALERILPLNATIRFPRLDPAHDLDEPLPTHRPICQPLALAVRVQPVATIDERQLAVVARNENKPVAAHPLVALEDVPQLPHILDVQLPGVLARQIPSGHLGLRPGEAHDAELELPPRIRGERLHSRSLGAIHTTKANAPSSPSTKGAGPWRDYSVGLPSHLAGRRDVAATLPECDLEGDQPVQPFPRQDGHGCLGLRPAAP